MFNLFKLISLKKKNYFKLIYDKCYEHTNILAEFDDIESSSEATILIKSLSDEQFQFILSFQIFLIMSI